MPKLRMKVPTHRRGRRRSNCERARVSVLVMSVEERGRVLSRRPPSRVASLGDPSKLSGLVQFPASPTAPRDPSSPTGTNREPHHHRCSRSWATPSGCGEPVSRDSVRASNARDLPPEVSRVLCVLLDGLPRGDEGVGVLGAGRGGRVRAASADGSTASVAESGKHGSSGRRGVGRGEPF